MRILFVVNRMAHVRHFDRAIRLLADRGHDVELASQDDDLAIQDILSQQPRIRTLAAPRHRGDEWAVHATVLRRARDYLRFVHPRYESASSLRERAFEKLVRALSGPSRAIGAGWSDLALALNQTERKRLDALLAKVETVVPPDPDLDAFLAARRPDVLVLSPMVGIGFSQADFVKSARHLRIPTALLVFSWDNLSNKGLIHEMPDRMMVWNKVQRKEAEKLHGFPADRVVVTGAPRFDEFFEMTPASSRAEFCGMLGIEPAAPILCYLCSSKFVAARELAFVRRWLAAIRASGDPVLARCAVVVRPHPGAMDGYHTDERRLLRWPGDRHKATTSRWPDDPAAVVLSSPMQNANQVLFDTLFHSAAVVGLNTSAEIEAGIVRRPVYTVIDPAAGGQRGTLHFHYLLHEHGGHVRLAESLDAHLAQLAEALAGGYDAAAIDAFVHKFVRPAGLNLPVAPIIADAIEQMGSPPARGRERSALLASHADA